MTCRRHSERQGLGTLTSATGRSRSFRGWRSDVVERRSSGEHCLEVPDVVRDNRSIRGDRESQSALGVRLRAGGPVKAPYHQLCCLLANDEQGLGVVQSFKTSTDSGAPAVRDIGVSHGMPRGEAHIDACRGNAFERLPLQLRLRALGRVSNQAARRPTSASSFESFQHRWCIEGIGSKQDLAPRLSGRKCRDPSRDIRLAGQIGNLLAAAGRLSPQRLVAPRALRCGRSRRGWDTQRSRRRSGRSGRRAATIQEVAEAANLTTLLLPSR